MKKISLKKLVLVFSIVGLLSYSWFFACGYSEDDWATSEQTNFTPEIFVDSKFAPFFLSESLFNDNGLGEGGSRFNGVIVDDWNGFFDDKIDKKDLSYFLIDSSSIAVHDLYQYFEHHKNNKNAEKWEPKINLSKKKFKQFITFLHYAKPIEKASVSPEYWDYEEIQKKRFTDQKWIAEIAKQYKKTSNDFLKNRYWFQVMKAYFYSDKPQEAITFFEKTSGKQPKNTLYYRAVSYLGGIYARTGQHAKANYCYSQVFDKCPELQVVAAFCFSPQENKDWNDVMQMTQSNEEKVSLWAIRGYYNDEENAIRNIYALNPKSDYLELLLSRLVNHLELKTNKTNNQLFPDEQIVNLDTLHKSTLDLIRSIADAKVCKKPYLWDISAGYIETMYGNYDKATIYFENAERLMPKTTLAQNQLRLLRFVNNLSSMKTLNDKNKASLLADLNWLYSELPNQQSDSFRFHNAVSWSKIMISELFKKQNDAVFAELFSSNVAFYDNKENLTAMKRFLLKTNKNAFDQLAIKIYQLTLEDINQFEAVVATFENHIDKAIALVENTYDFKNRTLEGNPFSGKIKDCNDCDHAIEQKKHYTILDFLKTIRKMQNEVAAGKDVYLNNLLIGNAFYNITFFGNARAFYEGQIMSSSSYLENFPEEKRNLISDCSKPNYYYQKAFEAATNDEQKAKCQYLLAKCERNEYYNGKIVFENNYWTTKYDQIDFRAWDGFVTLNKQYSKTKFYQEVLAECGYFRTYLISIKQD